MPGRCGEGAAPLPLFFLAGLVATLPFQKYIPGLIVFVTLVPFLVLLRMERSPRSYGRALRTGWLFGFGFYLGLLYWVALLAETTIPVRGLTLGGYLALSTGFAFFPAFFTLLDRFFNRRVPFLLFAPIAWGATEYIRSLGLFGFPWGTMGYALADDPTLIQTARLGGVDLLTFAVLLCNTLVATGVLAVCRGKYVRAAPALAAALLIPLLLHIDGTRAIRSGFHPSAPPVTVAVIQPNIPAEVKWTEGSKGESIRILSELTRRACGGRLLGLVVWPETGVPAYIRHEHRFFKRIIELVESIRVPLLFGFPDAEQADNYGYEYFNSSLLLNREGMVVDEYRKIHLVPFGERLPFHGRIGWITELNLGEADFSQGKKRTVFTNGSSVFSATICFEAIFPSFCRRFVRDGAQYLVNLTNDAWFGTTAAPYQHAAMARLRGVENGIFIARSANTGISFISDPFGRVISQVGLMEEGFAVGKIYPIRGDTFYVRHGDWLPRLEIILTLLFIWFAVIAGRRKSNV